MRGAHPQGPLALADLIGLDTTAAVAQSLLRGVQGTAVRSPPLLARMVDGDCFGRKSGHGFYQY